MARNRHTAADIALILSVGASAVEASLRLGVSQTYVEQIIKRNNISNRDSQQEVMKKSQDSGWKPSDNVLSYRSNTVASAKKPKTAPKKKTIPGAKSTPAKRAKPAERASVKAAKTKGFEARPDTLALVNKFPQKTGESAKAYASRIQREAAKITAAQARKTEAKIAKFFEKPAAPKTSKKTRTTKAAAAKPAAFNPHDDAAAAKNFRWGRVAAMRAQTMISQGKSPRQIAERIKVPIDSVRKLAVERFNPANYGKAVYATKKLGKEGKEEHGETTDPRDKHIIKDGFGRPVTTRSVSRPGYRSGAGISVWDAPFRIPSAPNPNAKITPAQKKEIARIVSRGEGNEPIRNYLEKIGVPSTTIADLAKARKAAGAKGPTAAGVAAVRAEGVAERKAQAERAEAQNRAAIARNAAREVARKRLTDPFDAKGGIKYVGKPGQASPLRRRDPNIRGPSTTSPGSARQIIPASDVRRIADENIPKHLQDGRRHARVRAQVIRPITVGGKEERYVSRKKVTGYTDRDGKHYKEGDLKPGEYEKIFDKKGKIRKGFKEVTEPVYSTRTVGGTTKMRGLRVLQGSDAPRKPFVAPPPPSAKPITSGPYTSGLRASIPKGSTEAGMAAVKSAMIALHGPAGGKAYGDAEAGIRAAVDRRIERRVNRGEPVSPKDIAKDFGEGGGAKEVLRSTNQFISDPKSPLLDRHNQSYVKQENSDELKRYTPRGTPKDLDNVRSTKGSEKLPSGEVHTGMLLGGEQPKTLKPGAVEKIDKSNRAEEANPDSITGPKGAGTGGYAATGDKTRPIPQGAVDESKRGYSTADIYPKLNQIAMTDPARAAEIAKQIGIKDFDPVRAAEQGRYQSASAQRVIDDVKADADKKEASRHKDPVRSKDIKETEQAKIAGIKPIQGTVAEVARAINMTDGSKRKGAIRRGGRMHGSEVVDEIKKQSGAGLSPEAKDRIAKSIPSMRGPKIAGANAEILSAIANDKDLAAKVLPEKVTAGKEGKEMSREEYIEKIKATKLAPRAEKAPKGPKAPKAPKAEPGKAKLIKRLSKGLRKVAEQRGAAVPDQAASADAPKRRGRPPKEKVAPPAAPPPGGDGGGPKESKGGAGKLPPVDSKEKAKPAEVGEVKGGSRMAQRYGQAGRESGTSGYETKMAQIRQHMADKYGISGPTIDKVMSGVAADHAAKMKGGISETQAWQKMGMLGEPGTSKNIARIGEAASQAPGSIDTVMGSIIKGAVPGDVAKEPAKKEQPRDAVIKKQDSAPKEKPAEKAAPKKKQAPKKPAKKKAPTEPAPKPEKQSKSGPKKESPAKSGKAGLPDPNSRLGQLYQDYLDVGFGKRQAMALAKSQEPMTPAEERRARKISNEGMDGIEAHKQAKAESRAKAAAKEQAAEAKAAPKAAPKAKAAPKSKAKAAPKSKTAPAPKTKAEPKAEKKPAAAPKTKAIKPMTQEKQRGALASAEGYKRGGAREAYKSLLKNGVDPQTAKQIVEDGRGAGIKGKQLVDYSNRRQKGMDHETAKAAATATKAGGAPSSPGKAGAKAAASGSSGSGRPPRGPGRTRGGGGSGRMPYKGDRSISQNLVGNVAAGADRGAIGAVKNSIGQITQSLITAQVIGQVGSLIKQITGGLIGFNMKLEESTIAFKTLFINEQRALGTFTGDVTQATMKANILTKSIQDFANVTPFRFGEIVTAAERMKAFGFETKEILPSLRGIGDAVAALGGEDDKLRRITYALGQMKQAGRVYQNDMMQLSNAGIAGYEILAKGLISEFIQTGKVMVGKSGEVYQYNSDTINQVVTDIVKNKGQGAYTVIKAQSNKLIDIFTQISEDPVEKIRNLTKRGSIDGQAAARYIIKGMEDTYQGGMEALARTMQGAISTVQDTSQYLIATSFKPIYDHIRNFFYDAGQFMMKAGGKRIADGIAAAIVPIGDTAARVIPKITSFFTELFKSVLESSGSFTSALAKIQVGTVTLATYIKENIVGGLKAVLEILNTDFGKAAVAAVAAMKIISSVAAANPLIIALASIVIAMGAVTNGMQKFMDTGSITRQSISEISEEEQATALAGIQVKESFIEIGSAITRAKKQMGPTINRIFTSLAETIAKVGSGAIVTIVNILQSLIEVLAKLLSVMSNFAPAIGVAIAGIVAIKVAAGGLALTTTAINSISTSMLAVAGAASAVRSGGVVGIIGAILGGGIKNRGANAISAIGINAPSVLAQQQAFATGAAVRTITAGEAAASVAITGSATRGMLGRPVGPSKEELVAAKQGAVASGAVGAQAAVAAKGTPIFTKLANVARSLFNVLIKAVGAIGGFFKTISKGLGKLAIVATIVLIVVDHFDGIVKAIGAVIGFIGRFIGAIANAIPNIPILGEAINVISAGLGAIGDAFDDIINISINSITNFFNSLFPEDPEIARIAALNTEIERLVAAGYSLQEATDIASAIQAIKDALKTDRDPDWMDWIGDPNAVQIPTPEQQDDYENWNAYNPKPEDSQVDLVAELGKPIIPGNITEAQRNDIRDNIDEIIANMDETQYASAEAAIKKAMEIRDAYKQMLIDAGVDTFKADQISAEKYKLLINSIVAEFTKAASSGQIDEIIPNLTEIIGRMAVEFSDASNGIDSVGYSLDKMQDGSVVAYLSDVEGHIEKIILYGEQAANLTAIDTLATSISGQARDAAIDSGVNSESTALQIGEKRLAEIKIRANRAMEGYYDDPIADGGEEILGRAEAIRRIRMEYEALAGAVDLGSLYSQAVESKIEKAKTALEKIKAALDPIVDRVVSRIRSAAEEQFAERIRKVTSLLEEQREAEIDAINVRVNGISTTYGMLEAEIKAQEKKNRVLQIEKTILDAREGVAKAAISSYGEDVDAIDAAINRRDAEKSMTEATKDAEMERSKLAIDSQETTIAGIQTVFDLRLSIVTKAIEDEKSAFNENIDDIVAKIKDGTIKGQAAVNAITGAFTAFGIAVPATAQAIAASGTVTISSIFARIITAVDKYRNKLMQVKAIEDSIGDDFPASTEADIQRTEAIRIMEEDNVRKGTIAAIKAQMQESMLAVFRQMTHEETNGVDGKPIAPWIKEKRRKEYTAQSKILLGTMPRQGDNSPKAIAALNTGWLEWSKWISSVHLVGRDFVNSTNYKAKGGPVNSRGQYIVGEKGPELLTMGSSSGEVISNFYVKKLTDAFKSFNIGNPAMTPRMAYNMGGGGKAELSVTINNPQVRSDSDIDKIVEAVNKSQMRMARRLGYS
jgi:hypothetical protein